MEPERYSALVSELEQAARTDPRMIRWRMFSMIAIGYGYVFAILFLVLFGVAGALGLLLSGKGSGLAVQLLIALGVVAWAIVRALWVTTEPPAGEELIPHHAPELTRRVEEICAALEAPRADTILLTSDFNASVVERPRLGIFGWTRKYLVLGVPLMFALTPRQFDAVLAHEFAHLSGSHPKRGLWVYRMSRTWQQLLDCLHEQQSWARKLFQRFVEWYVPRLQAYGFVASRQDEYAADADAAQVTSAVDVGGSLVALELRSSALEEFWREVWSTVESRRTPPAQTWSRVPVLLRQGTAVHFGNNRLDAALAKRADENDTHPSLAERLRALGLISSKFPTSDAIRLLTGSFENSAAEHYFRDFAPALLRRLDSEWREDVEKVWEERHSETASGRARIAALRARDSADSGCSRDERWELACLTGQLENDSNAEPYYRRLLTENPDHAGAHFGLGRLLLSRGEIAGVAHLQDVVARDSDATPAVCDLLYRFYHARNDNDGVAAVRRMLYEYEQLARAAAEEREAVRPRDTFVAAALPTEDADRLRALAAADRRISRLWVVRKVTVHRPDRPHFVLFVEPPWWQLGSWGRNYRKLAQDVVNHIELSIPCDVTVMVAATDSGWMAKRVKRVPHARIYKR